MEGRVVITKHDTSLLWKGYNIFVLKNVFCIILINSNNQ